MYRDEEYYEHKRDEMIDDRLCEGLCIRCCKPRYEYEDEFEPSSDMPGKPAKCPDCAPYQWKPKAK